MSSNLYHWCIIDLETGVAWQTRRTWSRPSQAYHSALSFLRRYDLDSSSSLRVQVLDADDSLIKEASVTLTFTSKYKGPRVIENPS